jgi:putative transposase
MLNVVGEFTREALAIRVARRLNSNDVIDVLSDLFILRGVPEHIRSDNGPEFIAKAVPAWITAVGAQTAYITPGNPWENGYIAGHTKTNPTTAQLTTLGLDHQSGACQGG